MQLEHYNIELKIDKDARAWRYMNFEKTWDFLFYNILYFSRLDVFNDPLEGLPSDIRVKLHLKNIAKLESDEDILKKLVSSTEFTVTKRHIEKWQKGLYASCWYLTENINTDSTSHHESLAMWQLYGNENTFAIKIKFDGLVNILRNVITNFQDDEIVDAKYGKIEYLNLDEHLVKKNRKNIFPSLMKDKSYRHENEVRFVLLRNNGTENRTGIRLDLKEYFEDLKPEITILCHPDLDKYSYNMYNNIFNKIGYKLSYSELLTRKVVNSLIAKV